MMRASVALLVFVVGCTKPEAAELTVALEVEIEIADPSPEADEGDTILCFVPCDGHGTVAGAEAGRCDVATPAACGFAGGGSRYRIVVDYGDVALSSMPEPAAVSMLVDGESSTGSPLTPFRMGDRYVAASSTLVAPAREAASFRVHVDAGGELVGAAPSTTITGPTVELTIPACDATPSDPCEQDRGVGTLEVQAAAPAHLDVAQASFEQTLDTSTITTVAMDFEPFDGRTKRAVLRLPVPASGQSWTVLARAGTLRSPMRTIALVRPSLTFEFEGCMRPPPGRNGGDSCLLETGSITPLLLTAPGGIQDEAATVTFEVGGIAVPGSITLNLDEVLEEGDEIQRRGRIFVSVPDAVDATWQATAALGTAQESTDAAIIVSP